MQKRVLSVTKVMMLVMLSLCGFVFSAPVRAGGGGSWSSWGTTFIHKATPANISCGSDHCTIINHPLTNNNASAILFVTQVWKETDGFAPNPSEIGVFYKDGKWGIVNEDQSAMPEDRAFFVQVMSAGSRVFKHETSVANLYPGFEHITSIDHASSNGSASRFLTVTRNHGTTLNKLFAHEVGVWYDDAAEKWTVFSEDQVDMPVGLVYNVHVVSVPPPHTFTHVASEENVSEETLWRTTLDHPDLNSRPNAHIQVTQTYTEGGVDTSVYNPHEIGLYYVIADNRWTISNQDGVAIPPGAAFNVYVSDTGLDVQGQKLLNGSFEVQSINAKTPAVWKVVNGNGKAGASTKARRLCPAEGGLAVAFDQRCTLQLKGGLVTQNVSQNLPKAGIDVDYSVSLQAYVEGVNLAPGTASIRVIATYAGGQTQIIKVPNESLNAGTYDYKSVSAYGELTQKPQKLTVKISMLGGAGSRLRVDAMHVYVYQKAEAKMPQETLTLPEASTD